MMPFSKKNKYSDKKHLSLDDANSKEKENKYSAKKYLSLDDANFKENKYSAKKHLSLDNFISDYHDKDNTNKKISEKLFQKWSNVKPEYKRDISHSRNYEMDEYLF